MLKETDRVREPIELNCSSADVAIDRMVMILFLETGCMKRRPEGRTFVDLNLNWMSRRWHSLVDHGSTWEKL